MHSWKSSVLPALRTPKSSTRCETPGPNIPRSPPLNLSLTADCASDFKSQHREAGSIFLRGPTQIGLILGAWRRHLELAIKSSAVQPIR